MREERGRLTGDVIVDEPLDLRGTVSGNVKVVEGGKVYIRGTIYGDLTVAAGGRVHIYGIVTGDLIILKESKVIVSGNIGGDAINMGGRLHIDRTARVMGRIRTRDGKTHIAS